MQDKDIKNCISQTFLDLIPFLLSMMTMSENLKSLTVNTTFIFSLTLIAYKKSKKDKIKNSHSRLKNLIELSIESLCTASRCDFFGDGAFMLSRNR